MPGDRQRFKQLSESSRSAIGVATFDTDEWTAVEPELSENNALQLRERLRQELESAAAAAAASGTALGNMLLLALEGALRGGPFDRVIVCTVDADRGRLRCGLRLLSPRPPYGQGQNGWCWYCGLQGASSAVVSQESGVPVAQLKAWRAEALAAAAARLQ